MRLFRLFGSTCVLPSAATFKTPEQARLVGVMQCLDDPTPIPVTVLPTFAKRWALRHGDGVFSSHGLAGAMLSRF